MAFQRVDMKATLMSCLALLITMSFPLLPPAAIPQASAQSKGAVLLTVSGEVEHSLKLAASDIAGMPHVTVKAREHSGEEVTFKGVALIEVLKMAGMKFGESMRGKALSIFFVVKGSDGYQVIFTPPELDPAFTDRAVLLADEKNGTPLSSAEGPLRIVVPDEKRQARWVRNVLSISVRRAD
jgi:DMSO/TMAO reductase YedYZ molybdopterin-dependent catalytic subunit